jgi:hypothetical protein
MDVVDTKPVEGSFPALQLEYVIKQSSERIITPRSDRNDRSFRTEILTLPATINPYQTPKLVAAGMALSPFHRNQKYSFTEARTRYLWLEFAEGPRDSNDDLFCRMQAYSPDQLISNNHPSLLDIPVESPLPLDPEYIRVVTPGSAQDNSGLNAMQKMERSDAEDRHYYLLPLPPGLHHESPD